MNQATGYFSGSGHAAIGFASLREYDERHATDHYEDCTRERDRVAAHDQGDKPCEHDEHGGDLPGDPRGSLADLAAHCHAEILPHNGRGTAAWCPR
jgi:hypothetical protein